LDFKGETMSCPQDSCKNPCDENVLRGLLDEQEIKLYEQKKLEKFVSKNPNMKFCPQAGCSRIYTPSKFERFTICKCSAKICNACGNLWHEKKTCFQASDVEFKAFQKANDVKFCVMCKTVVQKIQGCSHITCPVCDYDWCWTCGREFTSHHATSCPGKWSPKPPEIVMNELKEGEERKKKSKAKQLFWLILSIPIRFLFFGFFVGDMWKAIREIDNLFKKVVIIILGLIVSFAYVLLVVSVLVSDNGDTGAKIFIGIIFLAPFIVYMIYEVCRIIRPEDDPKNRTNKRWMTRDSEKFGYKSRATKNIQMTANQCEKFEIVLQQDRQGCEFDIDKEKQFQQQKWDHIFDEENGKNNQENNFFCPEPGRKNDNNDDDQKCEIKII